MTQILGLAARSGRRIHSAYDVATKVESGTIWSINMRICSRMCHLAVPKTPVLARNWVGMACMNLQKKVINIACSVAVADSTYERAGHVTRLFMGIQLLGSQQFGCLITWQAPLLGAISASPQPQLTWLPVTRPVQAGDAACGIFISKTRGDNGRS